MAFLKRHKKGIIILSVILLILITLIILMFTLFSLKNVEIKFESEARNITLEQTENMKKEIDLGGTVFFKNKTEMTNRIEKEFPYAKVVNIETVIPNKFVVHIVEREEVYALQSGENFYILDSELKVLRIEQGFSASATNSALISLYGLEFNLANVKEGSFLNLENINLNVENGIKDIGKQTQNILNSLISHFQINNKTTVDFKAMVKNMAFETYTDHRTGEINILLKLVDFNNFEITILSPNENMEDKISKMLTVYSNTSANEPNKLNTHKMTVFTNKEGKNLVVLEEKI